MKKNFKIFILIGNFDFLLWLHRDHSKSMQTLVHYFLKKLISEKTYLYLKQKKKFNFKWFKKKIILLPSNQSQNTTDKLCAHTLPSTSSQLCLFIVNFNRVFSVFSFDFDVFVRIWGVIFVWADEFVVRVEICGETNNAVVFQKSFGYKQNWKKKQISKIEM